MFTPFHMPGFFAGLLTQTHTNVVYDGLDLKVGISRGQDKNVGDSTDFVDVQNENVSPLLVQDCVNSVVCQYANRCLGKTNFIISALRNDVRNSFCYSWIAQYKTSLFLNM